MELILASASPRRQQLLAGQGLRLTIHPTDVDERPHAGEAPADYVGRLAEDKAEAALASLGQGPLLAADTVVALGDRLVGKPADADEACAHLRALSGRWHEVFTGVCVIGPRAGKQLQVVRTRVRFRALTEAEICRYVAEHKPLDKAGAYGIQGAAGALVAELQGSFTNVIGLPLEEALAMIGREANPEDDRRPA